METFTKTVIGAACDYEPAKAPADLLRRAGERGQSGGTMNHLLLAALLILVATNSYAQSPIEGATKDGRAVILKPDGTWEFKKAAPEPSATPAVAAVKASMPTDSLPVNFSGHETKILYHQLIDLKKRLVKSEFETKARYYERVYAEMQKPIIDNLTIKDTFSIVVSGVRADYDADSRKMQLFLLIEKSEYAESVQGSNLRPAD
jgi:hypothetical protein